MVELILFNYLKSVMDIPVFMEEPLESYDEYIIIQKTSSSGSNFHRANVFAIQSYSTSLYKASLLNEKLKAKMLDFINENDVSRCVLNSDYNYTDTTKKNYRYQAIYQIDLF